MAHRSKTEADKAYDDGTPRICMDYFYMNERDREEGANPLVIVTDEDTGDKYARAVGRKGVGEHGEMDWLIRDISLELKSWGHQGGSGNRMIMKADGERSLKALRDAVARYHGGIIVPEVSARGESQSNGVAEQAAQVVAEFVRVLKEQIEVKTKMKLSPEDTISLWMVRWASILCSKYMVGADGRGRRCRMPVVPFGERVLFKQIREGKNRRDKFESEDREGVWLGHNREANEVLIGTPSGVVRAFSYRRRSEGSRWDADLIKNMQGTPEQPDPTRPGVGIPIKVRFSEPAHVDEAIPNQPARQEQGPRRMRIMPYMLEKYGFTEGCEGCRHKQAGLQGARDHSETCRVRIMEAIRQDTSEFGTRMKHRHRNEIERMGRRDLHPEESQTMEHPEVLEHGRSHDGGEGSAASSTDAVNTPVDDAGLSPDVDTGLILNEAGVRCLLSI